MAGRPRLRPDALTPRQREVLGLLRLGLTNEEVAGRLGISLDGAKYHVSQILSKLGVASREEAAALALAEARPWWRHALALGFAAKAAGAALVLAALAGIVVLLWGVLRSDGSSEGVPPDLQGLTTEDAYERIGQAIRAPGEVLHFRVDTTAPKDESRDLAPYYTLDIWIDGGAGAMRSEFHLDPGRDSYDIATEAVTIVVGRYVYVPDDPGEALRQEIRQFCPGSEDPLLAALLQCGEGIGHAYLGGPDGDPAARVEPRASYGGRPAIALVYEAADAAAGIISTVYIDPEDFLPTARVTEVTSREGTNEVVSEYRHEFVALDSLPPDWLDPRSIGYGAQNAGPLLDEIAQEAPVYWLGEEFTGELEELVLTRIYVGLRPGEGEQVYPVAGELIYEAPDGYPFVSIRLWSPAEWVRYQQSAEGAVLSDPACARQTQIEAGGRPATVYKLPPVQFPGPFTPAADESYCNLRRRQLAVVDTIIGVAYDDDAVVQVRQDGFAESLAAMQALLAALQRR